MARPRVRERILDAAHRLMLSEGVSALTTRNISREAGTTEASVFNNFVDKEGLMRSLISERLAEVNAYYQQLAADNIELSAWLQGVYLKAKDFFRVVIPLTAPLWHKPPHIAKMPAAREFPAHHALQSAFERLRDSKRVSADCDPPMLATILLGAALHAAINDIAQGRQVIEGDDDEEARRLVKTLLPVFQVDRCGTHSLN